MLKLVIFILFVSATYSEDISFFECGKDKSANCDISALRLSPCPNVTDKNPCKLKRNAIGMMEIDFTPQFDATSFSSNLYWVNALNIDVPLPDMDTTGCDSTTCPLHSGQASTFKYNLTIKDYFPPMKYNVKCLLKKDSQNQCCFEFTIKIIK